jgi:nicotinamidase/pyrazinamidase
MARNTRLLLIDPQNDFCDLPAAMSPGSPVPTLPVPGAHADMLRVAELIPKLQHCLEAIAITLDSHHRIDIAHPPFWRKGDGGVVTPFTEITARSVRDGAFVPHDVKLRERALAYLDELEARGRYKLMVWPIHCEIGTWGNNVHDAVARSGHAWEEGRGRNIDYFLKGENPWTEHYSAAMAEVPLDDDPATQLNRALIAWADAAEHLVVAGEASSHCVRATVEHILENSAPQTTERFQRIVLLTDCMSPVPGFEAQAQDFLTAARVRGVSLMTSVEAIAFLK